MEEYLYFQLVKQMSNRRRTVLVSLYGMTYISWFTLNIKFYLYL